MAMERANCNVKFTLAIRIKDYPHVIVTRNACKLQLPKNLLDIVLGCFYCVQYLAPSLPKEKVSVPDVRM